MANKHNINDKNFGKNGTTVTVRKNDISGAIHHLRKVVNQEGITQEVKRRERYEKPCQKRRRNHAESVRNAKKKIAEEKELRGF